VENRAFAGFPRACFNRQPGFGGRSLIVEIWEIAEPQGYKEKLNLRRSAGQTSYYTSSHATLRSQFFRAAKPLKLPHGGGFDTAGNVMGRFF
jgi:hypothetical protein